MTGQMFKHLANLELDYSFQRVHGRPPNFAERQSWWMAEQGGIEEPYLLVVRGSDEDRETVIEAARNYKA